MCLCVWGHFTVAELKLTVIFGLTFIQNSRKMKNILNTGKCRLLNHSPLSLNLSSSSLTNICFPLFFWFCISVFNFVVVPLIRTCLVTYTKKIVFINQNSILKDKVNVLKQKYLKKKFWNKIPTNKLFLFKQFRFGIESYSPFQGVDAGFSFISLLKIIIHSPLMNNSYKNENKWNWNTFTIWFGASQKSV